jgi:hypothetical protein
VGAVGLHSNEHASRVMPSRRSQLFVKYEMHAAVVERVCAMVTVRWL